MRPDQTILFSDLDGTLFDSAGAVPERNLEAVRRYIAQGGRFAISTGRAPLNALRFVHEVPTNAPSVVFNGAGVYDFSTGEYAFLRHLDKAKTFPLLFWAIENVPCVDVQVYTDTEILYATPLETAHPRFLDIHRPARCVPLEELWDTDAVKALLLPNRQELLPSLGRKLEPAAPGSFDLKLGSVILGERISYYEVMPLDATKGAALRSLRSHPMVAGRTVLAVGDYWNDWEMLQEADVPVAPANAIPEIRALCRFLACPNDEGSIADMIGRIIPEL